MTIATVAKIVRDLIREHELPCELVLVQDDARTFRVTIRADGHRLVSFDVAKGIPHHVREAIRAQLELVG